ncbi:MAG: hypothetical protein ABI551_05135 [Polyangiaceae bacterium]
MRSRSGRALLLVPVLVTLAANASAAGDEKKACALAAEQAQRLRNEGKLGEALNQLRICTREVCPSFVKSDCDPWRAEVEKALPSVLVKAKDDNGEATSDVKVTIDGIVRAEKLDGEPLDVDPGAHLFHFDREGADPIEQKLVVKAGEKSRAIDLSFHLHPTNAVAAAPAAPAAAPLPPKAHRSLPIAGFVASGVAVAGLTVGTIFYFSAKSDIDGLKETCAPACGSSQVDPIGPKIIVSDVALGVGVVAAAAAVYFFVTHAYPGKASAQVGTAAPRAAPAGLSFTF